MLLLACQQHGSTDSSGFAELRERVATEASGFQERQPGRFTAELRGLRAELDSHGLLATSARSDGELLLRFSAWGREGLVEPIEPVEPMLGGCASGGQPLVGDLCPRRVELLHPGLTEYWRAVPGGVEQGWEIARRPAGDGALLLQVDIEGATHWQVDHDALGAELHDSAGRAWRYAGLSAWDARGQSLTVLMEAAGSGLRIVLDDAGAIYPVTVDPVLTEDTKLTASDGAREDYFGYSVSGAGDVDGDVYDDVVVGAYGNTTSCGSAYVYLGSSSGIDTGSETMLYAGDGASGDVFGYSVSGAGDVDGDGYDDIVVGAFGDGNFDTGSAYVFLGSSSGIETGADVKLTDSDAVSGDYFACSVSGAGDVDGDGYDDVIVGAYGANAWDGTGYITDSGVAFVYLGSSGGLYSGTETELYASDGAFEDYFGFSVSRAGDVDGDGYDDVIVGAYKDDDNGSLSGSAYVYLGSSAGIDTSSETKLTASDGASDDLFGYSVSGAGDVDGDGYADVVVGASYDDDNGSESGSGYVYLGNSAGIDPASEIKLTASDGASAYYFGWSVAGAGDMDGDGYDDVVVGAIFSADYSGTNSGAAYTYLGSSGGIDPGAETKLSASDGAQGDYFGLSVSGAGDVNGDGYDDVIVGASEDDDDGSGSGSAYVILGSCTPSAWYADDDGDSYGDAADTQSACTQPSGYVSDDTDCDDTDAKIHPAATDSCGDGVDSDCDGSGGADGDEDDDDLTWTEEAKLGSDDCDRDSDDDGLTDGDEVNTYRTDPLDDDSDDDGLTDGQEVNNHGTDPNRSDSDTDGLSDGDEVNNHATDPLNQDSDDDGLKDSDEVNTHGTDPLD